MFQRDFLQRSGSSLVALLLVLSSPLQAASSAQIDPPAPHHLGFRSGPGGVGSLPFGVLRGNNMRYLIPIFSLLFLSPLHAKTYEAQVVQVLDGDSVVLLGPSGRQRLDLGGIDAPGAGQAYGEQARQALVDLVVGRKVRVEVMPRDPARPETAVGRLWLEGRDIDLEMIRRGAAWQDRGSRRKQLWEDRRRYLSAEWAARAAHRGLWAGTAPLPPWVFRASPAGWPE